MDLSYKFEKDHIKILNRDVKIVVIMSDPSLGYKKNSYDWKLKVEFYLHRKLKWPLVKLDKTYYGFYSTKERVLDNSFDIVGLYKKYCKAYEQELIKERQKQMTNSQLQQCLNDWGGFYEEGEQSE